MKLQNQNKTTISQKNFPPAIIVALIGLIGVLVGASINFLGTKYQTDKPIEATQTAEAVVTKMVATITAVAEQNLETYPISIPLAGAHTSPTDGVAQPDEMAYKDSFYGTAIRIQIPVIGVDASIVQGDGWEDLKKGVGQKLGTANPGENGFIVLSAHNDIFGEIFRYLDQLQQGDEIILHTRDAQYSYIVEELEIVSSPNIAFEYSPNKSVLLLTSSYPYLVDDSWIVVFADLQ